MNLPLLSFVHINKGQLIISVYLVFVSDEYGRSGPMVYHGQEHFIFGIPRLFSSDAVKNKERKNLLHIVQWLVPFVDLTLWIWTMSICSNSPTKFKIQIQTLISPCGIFHLASVSIVLFCHWNSYSTYSTKREHAFHAFNCCSSCPLNHCWTCMSASEPLLVYG